MIPKIIHYIWLGNTPLPKIAESCIESWKKFCPDYEIKRWDESNVNLDCCKYCREAYDAKKYAFASDVLRFDILSKEGGIYLDIDVELLKPLDNLLDMRCFMGFEKYGKDFSVAPGLIIGSEKGGKVVTDLFNKYLNAKFINADGSLNCETICVKTTNYLKEKYNLCVNNVFQDFGDIAIFPTEYFCPINGGTKEIEFFSEKTYSKHLYFASWVPKPSLWRRFISSIKLLLKKIIGKDNYEKLKEKLKGEQNG